MKINLTENMPAGLVIIRDGENIREGIEKQPEEGWNKWRNSLWKTLLRQIGEEIREHNREEKLHQLGAEMP